MGKRPNLETLKCMFKRWHSFSNLRRPNHSAAAAAPTRDGDIDAWQLGQHPEGQDLCPVYVGKSRRRYLISSHLVDHPLLRVLAEPDSDGVTVGCEVVLFDHLLWMLENADPPPESLDELVEFYAC
ncbi:hypothetical protein ACLOJK_025837 [Asimina triloba]